VARSAIRRPRWANLNLVLFFAMPTAIIALAVVTNLGFVGPGPIPNAIGAGMLLSIAYLVLRLVDDYISVPAGLLRASAALLAVFVVADAVLAPPRPFWLDMLELAYFEGSLLYATGAFVLAALRGVGVTRRRMRAVATGSLLLGLSIIATVLRPLAPQWMQVAELCSLASGICFFLGFAPPLYLRRSWQEPELRDFLIKTSSLPRMVSLGAELRDLERAAAATLGTQEAWIGLWDAASGQLDFSRDGRAIVVPPDPQTATGQAWLSQQPQFSTYRPSPDRSVPSALGPQALVPHTALAAPISSGQRRFGVLSVFTPHAPIVIAEDMELVVLLAGQIAAMLETRALAEELAEARASAQSARLKDDFLSAAAHDLKTPLTTVVGQAQLLERRIRSGSEAGAYLPGISLISKEAQRLRRIVNELLDAARAERGQIIGECEPIDLVALTHEVVAGYELTRHRCTVSGKGPLVGSYDRLRVQQLIGHLIDNAVLYSPQGGAIELTLGHRERMATLEVHDTGIGIPPDDLPRLFSRFFRGSNVNDRDYAGMGLSLFICRAIVEQHGGRITVTSRLGEGSAFEVMLPLMQEDVPHGDV
jgi:signal transduction histidine kinase